jgi:hypothetical protein
VCGLGAVGASPIFGLVRRAGAFAEVLPTFVLVSRIQLAQQYRGNGHFLTVVSSSRRETMVGGVMTRTLLWRLGLGVGGAVVASGSLALPSHSCDGWVCDLGVVVRPPHQVVSSLIFGLIRGSGAFAVVLPTFVLVSRMQLAQQNRDNVHFLSAASSSRHETMVEAPCLGCQWGYNRVWIVRSSITFVDFSLFDLIFISRGIVSLFCREA